MKEEAIEALETVRDDLRAARALAEQERKAGDRGAARAGGVDACAALLIARLPVFLTARARDRAPRRSRAGPSSPRTSTSSCSRRSGSATCSRLCATRCRRAGRRAFDAALRTRAASARADPRARAHGARGGARARDRLRPPLPPAAAPPRGSRPSCWRRGAGSTSTRTRTPRARALGEDAWEIVRGDREPPRERFAAGLDIASLRLAVAALEAL